MAVLIKDMDLPISCEECQFTQYWDYYNDVPGENCMADKKFRTTGRAKTRPKWCPLEPIWESAMGVHVGHDLYRKVDLRNGNIN